MTSLPPGSIVASRYEILGLLGTGGMGMVFKAHDRLLEDVVAVKVLRPGADSDLIRRFRSEVRLARKVGHRNVCKIHDYGEDGELFYISMELVKGTDLKRVIQERGALPWREAYDLIVQVAEGLAAIHAAGVIHRDLKPANVMRDAQGVVRVMDFGIAKLGEHDSREMTAEGKVVGSPEYMSPEQVKAIDVDFRSDLYSLGIVAFELFTGRVPFHSDTWLSTMRKQVEEEPPLDDPAITPLLPASLVPVLRKALAKDPTERYPTSAAMLTALKNAQADLERQPTDEFDPPAPSSADRTTEPSLLWPRPPAAWSYPAQARLLVPTLCRALKHPDRSVRLGAADALGRTPDGAARHALQEALGDEDREVRVRVNAALRKLAASAIAVIDEPAALSLADRESQGASLARRLEAAAVAPPPPPVSVPGPVAAPPVPEAEPPPVEPAASLRPTDSQPAVAASIASPAPAAAPPPGAALAAPRHEPAARSLEPAVARPPEPLVARPTPKPKTRSVPWLTAAVLLAVAGLVWLYVEGRPPFSSAPPPRASVTLPPAVPPIEPPRVETAPPAVLSPTPSAPSPASPRLAHPTVTAPAAAQPKPIEATLPAAAPAFEPTLPTQEPSATTLEPAPPPMTAPAAPLTTEPPVPNPERPRPGDLVSGGDRGVTLPQCVKCPSPDYPEIARRFKRQGTVVLRALIDENGRVADVAVVTGVEWLTDVAVRAVRKWTFRPAMKQGVAVKVWIELPVRFDLPK
jgi:TonB family protein